MTDLRYAPPIAPVADVSLSELRPRSVLRACQLLVASTLLGFVGLADLPALPPNAQSWAFFGGGLAALGLVVAFTFWLVVSAYRGRNWARWTLVVLLAPSWIFGALEISEQLLQARLQEVVGLIANALDMLACWLLFFGKGSPSFFHGKAASVSTIGRIA